MPELTIHAIEQRIDLMLRRMEQAPTYTFADDQRCLGGQHALQALTAWIDQQVQRTAEAEVDDLRC